MPNTQQSRQNWRIHLTPPITKSSYSLLLLGIQLTFDHEPEYVLDLIREHLAVPRDRFYSELSKLTDEQIKALLAKPLPESYYIDSIKSQIRFAYITSAKREPSEAFLSVALSNVDSWAKQLGFDTKQEIYNALHNNSIFANNFWNEIVRQAQEPQFL